MRTRCHLLAAILALAGHLVGVAGLPLPAPTSQPDAKPAVVKKTERKCCCACGDGCGPCCCCSGGAEPAEPPQDEPAWHWVASVQVQKCFGHGPAGLSDLPPGLPVTRNVDRHFQAAVDVIHFMPVALITVTMIPPTPPPRHV
jgi:hypothetical protein